MAHDESEEIHPRKNSLAPPYINVTPLIDVLLVLLIIFMVVAPVKPAKFETKIPSKPEQTREDVQVVARQGLLVVELQLGSAGPDQTIKLNTQEMTLPELGLRLKAELQKAERADDKTVFIKGPKDKFYGDVVYVIDTVKGAGAEPIGLQIDFLD
jgi:biopolymer transport protein ExbD